MFQWAGTLQVELLSNWPISYKNTDGNKLCEQFISLAGNSLHFKSSLHSFQIQPSKSDYADHIWKTANLIAKATAIALAVLL